MSLARILPPSSVEGQFGGLVASGWCEVILSKQFEIKRLVRDWDECPVLDEKGKSMYETVPLDRPRSYPYTVFKAEQCDGLPRRELPAGAHSRDPIEQAERVLQQSGATI